MQHYYVTFCRKLRSELRQLVTRDDASVGHCVRAQCFCCSHLSISPPECCSYAFLQLTSFFNRCFGASDASDAFWSTLKSYLSHKYIGEVALSEQERSVGYDLRRSVRCHAGPFVLLFVLFHAVVLCSCAHRFRAVWACLFDSCK